MILSARIDKLISALGEIPPPTTVKIKGELVAFSRDAKALEDGESTTELEAQVAKVESEIKLLKSEFETERQKLKAELKAADAELRTFRPCKERRPEIEERILVTLEHPQGVAISFDELCRRLKIDDVVAVSFHFGRLRESGWIVQTLGNPDGTRWTCSDVGTRYVYALKLSGEYEQLQNELEYVYEFPELPDAQSVILRFMSTQGLPVVSFFIADKTGIRRALAQHHLDILSDGKFVARTQGKDAPVWAIDKKGRAYLAERGQL